MVEAKRAAGRGVQNAALEKARMERERDAAAEAGDEEGVARWVGAAGWLAKDMNECYSLTIRSRRGTRRRAWPGWGGAAGAPLPAVSGLSSAELGRWLSYDLMYLSYSKAMLAPQHPYTQAGPARCGAGGAAVGRL